MAKFGGLQNPYYSFLYLSLILWQIIGPGPDIRSGDDGLGIKKVRSSLFCMHLLVTHWTWSTDFNIGPDFGQIMGCLMQSRWLLKPASVMCRRWSISNLMCGVDYWLSSFILVRLTSQTRVIESIAIWSQMRIALPRVDVGFMDVWLIIFINSSETSDGLWKSQTPSDVSASHLTNPTRNEAGQPCTSPKIQGGGDWLFAYFLKAGATSDGVCDFHKPSDVMDQSLDITSGDWLFAYFLKAGATSDGVCDFHKPSEVMNQKRRKPPETRVKIVYIFVVYLR